MLDSLMPLSDTSELPSSVRGERSAKRHGTESEDLAPRCKKRKKTTATHHWPKKSRHSHHQKSKKYKCRRNGRKVRPKPEAPFNSTQFIMQEHDNLNDQDLSAEPRKRRDSSPYSDGRDPPIYEEFLQLDYIEETFMTEQFWSTYHDLNAERLNGLSKTQLVQEYFSVEEKLNILERELMISRKQNQLRTRDRAPSPGSEDVSPGEVPVDAETAAKIEVFRSEIDKLSEENENLRTENEFLLQKNSEFPSSSSSNNCRRCALRGSSSNTSDDEDGSSSSSSDDEQSSDSSSEESAAQTRKLLLNKLSPPTNIDDDTKGKALRFLEGTNLVKAAIDLVSDSGIASASSSDDLRSEEREVTKVNRLNSPVYKQVAT